MLRGYKPKYKKAIWFRVENPTPPTPAKPKPIAKYSRENKKRQGAYNRKVAKWKKAHPKCCFPGCSSATKDNHHTKGKLGDLLMDERWWAPLCRAHHNWVGENIEASRGIFVRVDGNWSPLIAPRGQWNTNK